MKNNKNKNKALSQTSVSGCSCLKCGSILENKRKKFCSDTCKYWYNLIKKDNEKGLPPAKKRNEKYFYMIVGSERAKSQSRQGKRSGSMVTGSMSAFVSVTVEEIVEVNEQNILKHFAGIPGYEPLYMRLGNQERVYRNDILKRFGVVLP